MTGWPPVIFTDALVPRGSAGFTLGFLIFIRPAYRADVGLLMHEIVHVRQWVRTLGLFWPLYLASRSWRLRFELEAYREQMKWPGAGGAAITPQQAAVRLASSYRLGITPDRALALLINAD